MSTLRVYCGKLALKIVNVFATAIDRCLAKRPEDRFPSAEALAVLPQSA